MNYTGPLRVAVPARWGRVLVCAIVLTCAAPVGMADVVYTTDGSRIVGAIERLAGGKLIINTDIAGRLELDAAKLTAIESADPLNIELNSGDRFVGPVTARPGDERGSVVQSAVGEVPVRADQIKMVWPEGTESPDVIVFREEAAAREEALKPKYALTIEAGGRMTEGNTDTLAINGRAEYRQSTSKDLLRLYLTANYREENDRRSEQEYRGGVYYEHNISERWYWYTRGELEHDEFENLDLRASVFGGAGYYWLKREDHELKTRGGVGYRHEAYDDGRNEDDFVADLGLDYRLDVNPWLQFTHSTTYTPSLENFSRYRLELDTAFAFPLKKDEWALKVGMRNDYNSRPASGRDRLDNIYYANVVLGLNW
jgi:putative salt-induced outer membrane protein YdiY